MKRSYARCLTLLAAVLSFASTFVIAQTPPRVTPMTPDVVEKYDQTLPSADYIRREVMIPMRDGVKLFPVVVMKKGVTKAPILLSRTPYNASGSTGRVNSQRIVDILEVMDTEFVTDNYIRVYQDIRGMHRSEEENPDYTDFWSLQAVDKWLAAWPHTVAAMFVAGLGDHEVSN